MKISSSRKLVESNVRCFSTTTIFRSSDNDDGKRAVGEQQQQTTTKKPTSSSPPSNDNQSVSKKDQLVRAVRDYGATVVVFHVAISLASLGFFYLVVSSGVDVVGLVQKVPYVGTQLGASSVAAGASTFVMAYAVHKVFAPVRISITLTAAPFIVQRLRAKGILRVKKSG